MKKLIVCFVVVLIVIGVVFLAPFIIKNDLIQKDEEVKTQWSQIETQLQRRVDLIPNLVNTVKGYAEHEKQLFTEIANARSALLNAKAQGPEAISKAEGTLNSALGRLLAISENYPNLKADQSFIRLQDELAGTENRIAVARTRYNNSVRDFNATMRKFPGSYFVEELELKRAEFYEAPAGRQEVEKAPEVKF